jgi:hypothetical protein
MNLVPFKMSMVGFEENLKTTEEGPFGWIRRRISLLFCILPANTPRLFVTCFGQVGVFSSLLLLLLQVQEQVG